MGRTRWLSDARSQFIDGVLQELVSPGVVLMVIKNSRGLAAAALLPLVLAAGCINYSSYQDARIVERGHSQGTVAVSRSKYQSDDSYDGSAFNWWVVDMNPRWGPGSRFDAAMRMSILFSDEDLGWVLLGADVRAAVFRKYLAVTVPITMAFGEAAFETLNMQPGVIATLPVTPELDINGSVRRSFYLNDGIEDDNWWLYNAGLGILLAEGWRLRPEIGLMVSDQDGRDSKTTYMQFGIGLTREK